MGAKQTQAGAAHQERTGQQPQRSRAFQPQTLPWKPPICLTAPLSPAAVTIHLDPGEKLRHYRTLATVRCAIPPSRHGLFSTFPLHKALISIQTRDTRCLISTCKIPANLPSTPRRGSPRWPREPRRKTPESSSLFSLPVLESAACDGSAAERVVLGVKIPIEGTLVV